MPCRFAEANRALIASRFAEQIGADVRLVSDVVHNEVAREDWQGRPASSTARAQPRHEPRRKPVASLSRARVARLATSSNPPATSMPPRGRSRTGRAALAARLCEASLVAQVRVEDLERTELGGRVICEDRELIYEEAPQAYKEIGQVIDDLVASGLVSVIAVYRPVLTYKVRRQADD